MGGEGRTEDKVIEITRNGKTVGWVYQSFVDALEKFEERQFRNLMYIKPEVARPRRLQQKQDHVVFAYILVGKTRRMCWYNIQTEKAYKIDKNYGKTWMEWSKFQFVRFCTGFDV